MKWDVDFKELIPFLGKTIYRPENVLVELCANCYDADASIVEISTSGESEQILVRDDGCGMDIEDLKEVVTIAKSKKRTMIEKGETTPKFDRRLLGSFGIGIVSFYTLGDFIRIFTLKEGLRPLSMEIRKVYDGDGRLQDITISDPEESEEWKQHLLNPEECQSGTTIEINNKKLDFTRNYDLIRHKLANLPLSSDFKIILNGIEVKKDDFDETNWIRREFDFTLDSVDPSYQSKCRVYVNHQATISGYKRGIYLVVNGRVIEKGLYSMLYPVLESPAAIAARVRGFIEADYLQNAIQANREDFFETEIINEIKDRIRGPVQQVINDYMMQRRTEEKEQRYTELLQRIEQGKNRFRAPNRYLQELGINFATTPKFEQEVVLIVAQLCQEELLPFQILDYNSASHIDCVVKWPLSQTRRDPTFISELEIETSLDHFFDHSHDFRTKPDVCCWETRPADFERKKTRYMDAHPASIQSIELREPTDEDKEHFGHQKEMHFTIREAHNELRTFVLRVYVISEIIKELCEQRNE